MAKKSDFTQKLLDDLRRRKEQMAMAQTSTDAHGNFRRPSRGYKDANSNKINRPENRPNTGDWLGGKKQKPLALEETSKEIVPVGRARNSQHINLSMVLAFALQNGGKLRNMEFYSNPNVGKEVLWHQRSRDFRGVDARCISDVHQSSTSRFAMLSNLHIEEISKGAHKLNQILKACSNGLNFDRYSIEIGKELLKGAMDLEESLAMLANLQEASDYMVRPRRKQIQLLDGNEEDEATVVGVNRQKLFDKPRFSFDGSSRNSLKDTGEFIKTSLLENNMLALSYPANSKTPWLDMDKHAPIISSNSASHRHSVSCTLDSKVVAAFSGVRSRNFRSQEFSSPSNSTIATETAKGHSNSASKRGTKTKPPDPHHPEHENGRIPNVIAKLMGLEELPPRTDSKNKEGVHNELVSKQGKKADENSQQNSRERMKEVDLVKMNLEKIPQIDQQKLLQLNKITVTRDIALETVISKGRPIRKELKNKESIASGSNNSQKRTIKIDPQMYMKNMDPNAKEHKNQEGNQMFAVTAQKPLSNFNLQKAISQMQKHPEVADGKQEMTRTKKSIQEKEHNKAKDGKPIPSDKQKPLYDDVSQNPYVIQQSELQDEKPEAAEADGDAKIKLRVKDVRKIDMKLKNSPKNTHEMNPQKKLLQRNHTAVDVITQSKGTLQSNHKRDPRFSYESFNYLKPSMKKSLNGSLQEEQGPFNIEHNTDVEKAVAPIQSVGTIKSLHIPSAQKKVDNTQIEIHKSKKPRKMDEEMNRKVGSPHTIARPVKQQRSVLQELKQRRHERISKAKKVISSIQPLDLEQQLRQNTLTISPSSQKKGANTNSHNMTSKDFSALQPPAISLDEDQALQSSNVQANQSKGPIDCDIGRQQHQTISRSKTEVLLTEHENYLKQILVQSQYFLNAAEALFQLQIPVSILHTNSHICQDKESKLVLDCGYEMMKRKGKRADLAFHPSVKMSVVPVKVKCLDDLIKALHEDLDYLNTYCSSEWSDYDAADCLHKMLKRDIQNTNLDSNSMWDFGWSGMMFAYFEKDEVVRDVEKHLLNGLIDELAKDLLHRSIDQNLR